jgi:hypothetical protein
VLQFFQTPVGQAEVEGGALLRRGQHQLNFFDPAFEGVEMVAGQASLGSHIAGPQDHQRHRDDNGRKAERGLGEQASQREGKR